MTLGRKTGGRQKEFDASIRLPLTKAMLDELDAVIGEDEERVQVIRHAIQCEIKRRNRTPNLQTD